MAAATNHAHDQQEMDETFYLSNIVPQEKTNNAGCVCVRVHACVY